MSSVRPTQRILGDVRPQGQPVPVTTTWSEDRYRSMGVASRANVV
jgi:hypothetical protein